MQRALNVLILEDAVTDVALIDHELQRAGLSFRSKRVETKDDFLAELEQRPPDLILSDHGLPSFDGFTALAIARDKAPDAPFIFVTGTMGEELAIDSLRSGASDYVLKTRLHELVPAVQRALRLTDERTKRKEAERELRDSEERFRMLVSGVKDYAIFMLDPEGRVSSWNTGAQYIQGYRSEEIIGRHFGCFYRPEDRERGKPAKDLETAARDGRLEEEAWRVRQDGNSFWALVFITSLLDESGRLRGFAQVTRDITEIRRTREAVGKSEERYRQLVELCPDALFVLGDEGHITFVNTAARKLLGAEEPARLVGKNISAFVQPDGRENFHERLQAFIDGRAATAGFERETFVRLDGASVSVEVAAARLASPDKPAVQLMAHDITQREAAAAALRESEARKTAILETSLDAIICLDSDGLVREWNASAEHIFGYRRTEALGRTLDQLIVPAALRERYRPSLTDYLMAGAVSLIGRPIEVAVRRASGEEFMAELAITRTPAGEPTFFTAFLRDVTERRRAEQALRQSEARKAAVIETAVDAIVGLDGEGRIIEWNPVAEKIFGYSRALALGRDLTELIMPHALQETRRKGLPRFLEPGRGRMIGQRHETTAKRANGAEFPVEIAITQVPGEDPPMYLGFIRDITERLQTEEALRKGEERFRLLVDGVKDYAIYMLDVHGRIVTWNSGAERFFNYHSSEIIGRRFDRFFTPEDVERGQPERALAVATAEGEFQEDGWRVRKDGSRYWATTVITTLRDKEKLYGFSVITRDITERKRA
ncbi:MAG: PAS domain S-box protein, partial [Verrucomicrobiota bacterium]|nr:PAS domain S-box protein [Verrucomicrobiota bacterium]